MATDSTQLMIGPGIVSIGAWVTAGGAGSLTDVGHTAEPIDLTFALEVIDRSSERSLGIIASKIVGNTISLNIPQLECTPEQLRVALAQPASSLSGGTLQIGDSVSQFHQIQIVQNEDVPGSYTTLTVTLFRCQINAMAPIRFAKGEWTTFTPTFRVLRDDSVSAAGKYGKAVYS